MKKLTELEELNVSGNHLTTLPPSLGHLTKLAVLRVHSNSLHSLLNFHDAVSLRVSNDLLSVVSCIYLYLLFSALTLLVGDSKIARTYDL